MAVINVTENKTFYLDNKLKKNIDILLDACKEDDDFLLIFDGAEGAGKSLFMRQVGYYCAQRMGVPFTVDNIHFQLNSYVDKSIESPFYTINILDESRKILNKRAAMSRESKKFTNYLSECRKKRQIHLIALPAFHELDKNIVLWRAKLLIHVDKYFVEDSTKESGFGLKRGDYRVYLMDQYLKKCYLYPYSYPKKYEFTGQFKPVEVIDLSQYESKKDDNLELKYHSKYEEIELGKREKMWRTRTLKLVKGMEDNRQISRGEMADVIGMEVNTLNKVISQHGE